jgi:peptidyl-prolyl cis-trans isomerase D
MLKVFRDNLKYLSWVLWLVIAVFILIVFVDFGGSVPGGTAANTAAVKVDGREISYGEFERAYRQTEDTYRRLYGEQFSTETARQLGLPMQVINGLIADRLLLDEASRMGLEITDEELQREILAFPAFQREDSSFVGAEEYQRILRQSGMSSSGFEDLMRSELLTEKVRAVLAENVFVPDGEVERVYRRQVEQARIRFIRLPKSEIDAEIEIDEAEMVAFFEDNRDDYRIPERRTVEYLLVDRREIQSSLAIEDADVRAYYDENPEEFSREEQVRARHILLSVSPERTAEQARAELEEARQRLASGADFAELARQLSDDPGSKDRGGDLGLFGRGDMVAPFEAAAFGAEPGEVVGPVETDFGLHLIEVLDKQPGGSITFSDAEQGIRSRLLAQRAQAAAEEKATEISARLSDSAEETVDLEAIAAEETSVTYHSTDPFGRDDNVPGIGRASQFSVTAFDLVRGEISGPVPTAGGWAVLELQNIEEPRLPELDEVRDSVERDLREEKLGRLAVDRLAAAALALADGSSLEDQADEIGLEIQESELFGVDDPVAGIGRATDLAEAALDLEEGTFGGPVEVDDAAVLFEVVERRYFDPATFAEEKESTRQTLEAQRLNELLSVMLDVRRAEADIVFDPQLLATFAADEQSAADS